MEELVNSNLITPLRSMPNSFNQEQEEILQLFKNRIYFEKILEETVSFNKTLNWNNENYENIHLTTTAEELIRVFSLRSEVYGSLNYGNEFPDIIKGLNFDDYDPRSAIVYVKNNNKISYHCRSKRNFPSHKLKKSSTISVKFQDLSSKKNKKA